jgi:hypothetical protein
MKEVIFSLNLDISPSSMLDKNEFYEQTDTLGGRIIQNTNFNILNCNRRYKKTHGKTFNQGFNNRNIREKSQFNLGKNKDLKVERLVHHPGEKLKDDHILIPISKEMIEKYTKLSLKQLPM